jgi:ribonuclease HII
MAMSRAFELLTVKVDKTFVDGRFAPDIECSTECVIGGDNTIQEIMAASILAKCARDIEMKKLAKIYPQYGFEKNKGYPTKFHKEALAEFGLSPIHRRTFGPCKTLILDSERIDLDASSRRIRKR